VKRLFVVKDLERLKEYGFVETGRKNSRGRLKYWKELGVSKTDRAVANLTLVVNSEGSRENEIIVCCEPELGDTDESVQPVMWAFDELSEMLHDDVIAWSKLPRP